MATSRLCSHPIERLFLVAAGRSANSGMSRRTILLIRRMPNGNEEIMGSPGFGTIAAMSTRRAIRSLISVNPTNKVTDSEGTAEFI